MENSEEIVELVSRGCSLMFNTDNLNRVMPKTPPPTPIPLAGFNSSSTLLNNNESTSSSSLGAFTCKISNNNNNSCLNWPNSLFQPPIIDETGVAAASRLKLTNRRECKSTSDESYVYELNNVGELDKDTNNKLNSNFTCASSFQSFQNKQKKSGKSNLNGQFGFNPNLGVSIRLTTKTENRLPAKLSASSKEKKSVKRLSSINHKIENFKKHSSDLNQEKKLFFAVSNNDFNTVSELLNTHNYDVNCCDDKQRTCLHIASSRGYVDIVKILLEYGANPNIRDCVNNLPIHLAIISSHVAIVTILLESGTDIHTLDLNGKTVLHLAGTRLRWLLNDENQKAPPKLKFEAIMIMNMIKEYLRRKKASTSDLDLLADRLENVFNLDDINSLTKELLDQFETLNIKSNQESI